MFIDSTLLVDFLRNEKSAISFMEKIRSLPLYTSEINMFELIEGAYLSKGNPEKHILKINLLSSRLIILPFDRKSVEKAGMISGTLTKKGEKIGELDCMIGGICIANGINQIVTKNKKHFERIPGLKVVSY